MTSDARYRRFEDLPGYPALDPAAMPTVDLQAMIEVDRVMEHDLGITLIQMMENAGRCLARLAQAALANSGARILVLAGRGGNGGGGLTAARRLAGWGYSVDVVVSSPVDKFDGVPAHQLKAVQAMGIPVRDRLPGGTGAYDLILDALVGYALAGNPRGLLAEAIALVNGRSAARCLSLDVPSGFSSQLGRPAGSAIDPDAILTIAALKSGLIESYPSTPIFLADISVPASVFAKVSGHAFAPETDICRVTSTKNA